ncbi:MAG: hypothetical protein HKO67_06145 [Flavobacteriaceae bacterium]|nr:hypothetical protein [Flavobacteriaceae bacterium]
MRFFKLSQQKIFVHSLLTLLFLITFQFVSCNSKSGSDKDKKEVMEVEDVQSVQQDTLQKVKFQTAEQACKYNRAEQTDAFISSVKELEGYTWDDKEKTAELVLNDHWGLSLKRGGCDHFELSATFIYDRNMILEENKALVFDQVKWITGLIEEFDSEQIAEALDSEKIYIQEVGEGDYFINFNDERLEYYHFRFRTWENATNFKIGKYIE